MRATDPSACANAWNSSASLSAGMPIPVSATSTGDHKPKPKPAPAHRPLRIAGGAALGVGLALGGGMVAALARGAALRDQAEALRDQSSGQTIRADDAST
jgi:hypothetical protein